MSGGAMAVLDNLERAEGFTDAERSLAEFILAHADEVTRMSIACLAAEAYTSNATIIRLCRKLGSTGFREFRVDLVSDLEKRRVARADVDVDHPFERDGGPAGVTSGLASLLKEAIDTAYAAISPREVDRAARIVHGAGRVNLFAMGDSQVSAIAFANMLIKLGIHAAVASQYGETIAAAEAMRPHDAAVFVSYSGKILRDETMMRAAETVRACGCRTIWVSAGDPPFRFDAELRFPRREGDGDKVATFYSQMCIRYALDCVYGAAWTLARDPGAPMSSLGDIDTGSLPTLFA